MSETTTNKTTVKVATRDYLTNICEQVQVYADAQGLYFDDEDRDNIDEALRALLERLELWGEPVPIVARSINWRVRFDGDDCDRHDRPLTTTHTVAGSSHGAPATAERTPKGGTADE